MRSLALSASLAALLLIVPGAAASSLTLTNGQVIKGRDLKRSGDSYLITLATGNTVAFPLALVKAMTLEDDTPAKAPPGFDMSGPKTLAGPTRAEMHSQDAKDQLKVLGPSTRWSKDAIDTTWVPTNAYDPNVDVMAASRSTWSKNAIDTTWLPTSAYDTGVDVLAFTRSTWSKNAIDTTWKPTDGWGFRDLSSPRVAPTAASSPVEGTSVEATPAEPTPWSCAEGFFAKDNRSPSMSVKPAKDPLYAALGIPIYEATGVLGGVSRKALFTLAGGECRLVGGDADALIGLNLPADHAMAQDAAAFNTAMSSRGGVRAPVGGDKLEYALAFVSLTDPHVSGSAGAALTLIKTPTELRSIATKTPGTCALSKGKRRKEERVAASSFSSPRIVAGSEGDVATFLTWSSVGGTLVRNTVVFARGGVVSAKRDIVASHLGTHQD